jgi:hypothetical protein
MPATISVLDSAGSTQTVNTLPALGQGAKTASLPVAIASDQDTLKTGGNSVVVGATFNRPADTTAYAVGDLIANSTTAGSVVPVPSVAGRVSGGTGVIRRIRVSTTQTGLAGTEIVRVHLFKASPTVTNGDNGAFAANGVTSIALGYTDVVLNHVYNDGSKGFTATDIVFDTTVQTLYALFETRTAFTPSSAATYALALEVLQD